VNVAVIVRRWRGVSRWESLEVIEGFAADDVSRT
jgi:hypothetical protein